MATIQEMIKKTVNENYDVKSGVDKIKFEEVLTKVVENGMSLKDAMGFDDKFIEMIYSYGYNLYQSGKYDKAEGVFEILRSFEPKNPKYSMAVGACHHKQKNYMEAIQYYVCAGGLSENDPVPYHHASDCFIKMNNKPGAILMMTYALKKLENLQEGGPFKERLEQSIKSLQKEIEEEEKIKKNKDKS